MLEKIKQGVVNAMAALTYRVLSHREVQNVLVALLKKALRDEEIRGLLWTANHNRPTTIDYHWSVRPNSVEEQRFLEATRESADYATRYMSDAPNFAHPHHLLNFCLDRLEMPGQILEFGVAGGTSINHIARQTSRTVHGFDSFHGLPEQWGNAPAGEFDQDGRPPEVDSNVELHAGLFSDTLPGFIENHPEPVALLHIDCDLYSSTRTVLSALSHQIVPGTMIVFDEYFNYPGWQHHEHKAFSEFVESTGKAFKYIGYANKGFSVAVRIT